MSADNCELARCGKPGYITYYGRAVCAEHWLKHCEPGPYNLKRQLGITEADEPKRARRAVTNHPGKPTGQQVKPQRPEAEPVNVGRRV